MFFNRDRDVTDNIDKIYELFLDSLEDETAILIRGIDLSFRVFKEKMADLGYTLTEVSCVRGKTIIKRNQNGFYVDETYALLSDNHYRAYGAGLELLEEYRKDFERTHRNLKKKETIMAGNYRFKKNKLKGYENVILTLGYGSTRRDEIMEADPNHPSLEFEMAKTCYFRAKNENSDKKLIKEIMSSINTYLLPEYQLIFDDVVFIGSKKSKERKVLIDDDGIVLKRKELDNYFASKMPFVDVYLRIMAFCLEKIRTKTKENSQK